jgi:predicted transcriptional regulator
MHCGALWGFASALRFAAMRQAKSDHMDLRLEPELRKQLEELAAAEQRTLANTCRLALWSFVRQRERSGREARA